VRAAAVDFNELNIDALIISGAENVRYLSGYTGSNGMLVLHRSGDPVLFTDPRYEIQVRQEVDGRVEIVRQGGLPKAVAGWLRRKRARTAGFERAHLTYEQYLYFDENLGGSRLVPVGRLIELQRMVKSDGEIAKIRRSVMTNSAAFDRTIRKIRPGVREADVAAEMDYQMRRLGAEKPAFDTIVASGERTALPHAHPTSRKLASDELLLIDAGAFQDGYASDMTRMIHLGRVPAKVRTMYRAVLEAQLAAIDAVREGVTAARVDRAARDVLAAHGLDKQFTHSTGHGLGLEIHEPPRLGKIDKTRLRAGMAITIEPGAYIEQFGGIRIEDTVVVTSHGCEILTPTSKELVNL
jgi:Xaa-Pro aminopeptidase